MMTNSTPSKLDPFARLLADYRARIYESYFSFSQKDDSRCLSTTEGLNNERSSTLLVVEDNADQWLMTQLALQQHFPSAQLKWVSEPEAVMAHLEASPTELPCMILVDLYLPTLEQGLQVLRTLKAHPRYQSLPTIMLSWSNQRGDILAAYAYSADGFLVKPTRYADWPQALRLLDPFWNRRHWV
ncbi:response regulator [Spirosoma gilvum]